MIILSLSNLQAFECFLKVHPLSFSRGIIIAVVKFLGKPVNFLLYTFHVLNLDCISLFIKIAVSFEQDIFCAF